MTIRETILQNIHQKDKHVFIKGSFPFVANIVGSYLVIVET